MHAAARSLPRGFLWGASWGAYEVEGNCLNTDLWAMEHAPGSEQAPTSGDAIDFYHRWTGDLKLLASLGLRAVRLSIEWSRIEPEPGRFSQAAVDHYAAVLRACHGLNLSPIVVLHHLASPRWLQRFGGWGDERVVGLFQRYCAHVASTLGDWMPMVIPMYALNAAEHLPAVTLVPSSTLGFHDGLATPYWQASPERIAQVMHAARQTIGVVRPHSQVGASWWVGPHTRLQHPDQADFLCLEFHHTADVLQALRHPDLARRACLLVDHGVAHAGADANALNRSTEQLLAASHTGARLTGWLHGAAFDGWQGRNGWVNGLISVDRRRRLARHISPAVRTWSARMTALSTGERTGSSTTH